MLLGRCAGLEPGATAQVSNALLQFRELDHVLTHIPSGPEFASLAHETRVGQAFREVARGEERAAQGLLTEQPTNQREIDFNQSNRAHRPTGGRRPTGKGRKDMVRPLLGPRWAVAQRDSLPGVGVSQRLWSPLGPLLVPLKGTKSRAYVTSTADHVALASAPTGQGPGLPPQVHHTGRLFLGGVRSTNFMGSRGIPHRRNTSTPQH
jgi:hypothetical protein